ncbi:MAG: hypothetical protein R3C10_06910 [Pirellulales bacterium]
MSTREVRCSAGVNFGLLYPNGDVYRCMRDYNTRMPPIGNILDDDFAWHDRPLTCQQRVCNTSCDSDWASKWLMSDGAVDRHVPATEWNDVTQQRHPWRDQTLENPQHDAIMLIWTPTLPCNYSCSYCGCAAGKAQVLREFPSATPELTVAQWQEVFARLTKKFSWGQIQTNGGEPFLSDALIPVFEQISQHFSVNVVTNASLKMYELTRSRVKAYDAASDTGLQITASLHPTSHNFRWDSFLGNVLMLKGNGLLRGVNFVGWPGQLFMYEYYRDVFAKYDVEVLLQPWVGMDNEGYQGYTPAESEYVQLHTRSSRKLENQLDLSDYIAMPDHAAELEVSRLNPRDEGGREHIFAVRVTNAGTNTWNPAGAGDVRLGTRLFPASRGKRIAVREDRADLLGPIASGEGRDVEITVRTDEVAPGDYELAFDVVHENKFWFADLGSAEFRMPLVVGHPSLRIAS